MQSTEYPANLVLFQPGLRRDRAVAPPRLLPRVMSRRRLFERLETVGRLAPGAALSFLVVRVDGCGGLPRAMADNVLSAVAERIRELVRPTDSVGRFDPSAFAVVLQGTGATASSATAARLTLHLDEVVARHSPLARVAVYAETGSGANALLLPIAASGLGGS